MTDVLTWLFKLSPNTLAEGEFQFLCPLPGEVRLLAFAVVLLLTWLLYRRTRNRVSRRTRTVLLTLRGGFYALVLFLLGMPALRFVDPLEVKVFTAVLVDTSQSMGLKDAPDKVLKRTRLEAASRVLTGAGDQPGLLTALGDRTETLVYAFDAEPRRVDAATELKPLGDYTNLFRAVRTAEGDTRSLPLSSVVLFTDGCTNRGGSAEEAAQLVKGRHVPLHVVGVGSPAPPRDYEVVRVMAPSRVRPETEVQVSVTVRHTGLTEPFEVLLKQGQRTMVTHTIQPAPQTDLALARLTFTPDHTGTATYTVQIPPTRGEAATGNNSKAFTLDLLDDRLPVLYLEGSPRTEYRFLRRAMFRDRNFRLVGVLRTGEGKYYVQGAAGAERSLAHGFPTTEAQLYKFETLILGDLEASYFTPQQLALVEKFVRVRGGGLLMLGGVNSFGLGGYAGTPVGNALPVDLVNNSEPYSDELYSARVTPGGLEHPVMRLSLDPIQNRSLWDTMPKLIGITPVEGVKPGAQLLIQDDRRGLPVLAVQNYGAGRVAAFTSGGSWYWQMSMPAANEFHERFWKQLVRWLVMGAKAHLSVETDSSTYARGEPVIIRATVLGEDLQPINDARVTATITDPLHNSEELSLDWILSTEGVYQCRYVPEKGGDYRVTLEVAGRDLKPVQTGFRVGEPMVEFSNAGLKHEALRAIAKETGGEYFEYPDYARLADRVLADVRAARKAHGSEETRTIPLWDMPLLFLVAVLLLTAEWIVRRAKGLA